MTRKKINRKNRRRKIDASRTLNELIICHSGLGKAVDWHAQSLLRLTTVFTDTEANAEDAGNVDAAQTGARQNVAITLQVNKDGS